jgi:hypothetical protein
MKIVVLDVYKKSPYRISKDTNGGYGVENDLGSGMLPSIMSRVAKHSIFWPPLSALNLVSEFHGLGDLVTYTQNIDDVDGDVDYVFLAVSIVNCDHEVRAAQMLKAKYKDVKIFAFGPFVEFYSSNFRAAGAAVIIGEPEFLAQQIKMNNVNLRLLYAQGEIHVTASDPDKLAPARWSKHIRNSRNLILGNYSSFAPIIASRGCPYSCYEYCTYPLQQGRKVRSVDPNKMIEDINWINADSGARNFVFRDPVFSINKKYTYALLEQMASRLKKFSFTVETHLNNIDEEMGVKLSAASVKWVKFGIESASPEVMSDVSRHNLESDEQVKNIEILKSNGIKTNAMYIVCQPLDTYKSIGATVDYAIWLDTDIAQFSMFTPYPGTPYFEKVKDTKLLTTDYERFTQFGLVYRHEIFTPNDARKILGNAYKKYYISKLFHLRKSQSMNHGSN